MKKNIKECLILITFFLITLILYYLNIPIPCLFHKITGLKCPGCGITRMFVSLLKLDIITAFNYNPLCFIYLILAILYLNYYSICIITKNKPKKINQKIWTILLIITILFGIIRNIPIFNL